MSSPGQFRMGGGPYSFTELADVIENMASLIDEVVARLTESQQLGTDMTGALEPIPGLFRTLSNDVIQDIGSRAYDEALAAHQLNDGDPAWEFKRTGYLSARERYRAWIAAREPPESGDAPDLPWWKEWAQKAKKPLTWANVILRSVAASVPGGGALDEMKDGVEATVDELAS